MPIDAAFCDTLLFIGLLVVGAYSIYFLVIEQWLRLRAWRRFASNNGLTYTSGFLFGFPGDPPKIFGMYKGRAITITAFTRGRLGYGDAETRIVISVRNPYTTKYPRGAGLFLRARSKRARFFQDVMDTFTGSNTLSEQLLPDHDLASLPANLVHHLLDSSLRPITNQQGFIGLLIHEQNLYYHRKNIAKNPDALKVALDQLCTVADRFERFAYLELR